ncbi:DUF4892 domain-containing protein [Marinobacterium rhizophilum]|uniref:DUF4892 domain-containing protein n=1 Tax=Marinobacterium rhizophilum TaxID=420402 RepID=A0ABY5HN49_9GAMM|nr:DUF4892 domain-containing protein [Marinobacterium rhizophilum]UTW13286.1 DUF4892 domain-containing protein [Marinobacterium rhizophilum]
MLRNTCLLLAGLLLSCVVAAQSDVEGAADYGLLKRFPLSWIESYQQGPTPEYLLMLSELKKANNIVVADKRKALDGQLTRITYRIPESHQSADAFEHFRDQLMAHGAEVLFQCTGRDCGSSHYWANDFFGIAQLYGLDRTQFYMAARLGADYLALYAVQRGNRRVYLQLDVVSAAGGSELVQQLKVEGYAALPFDPAAPLDVVDPVVQLLAEFEPGQAFWLVVHQQGRGAEETLAQSGLLARQIEAGVRSAGFETVQAFGVGPLVPSVLAGRAGALVVIRQVEP